MTEPSGGGVNAAVKAWLATPSQNVTYVSGADDVCACAPFVAAVPPNATAAVASKAAVMKRTLMVALLPRERSDGFSSSPLGRGCNRPVVVAIRRSAYPRFVTALSEHEAASLLAYVSELRDLDDPFPFPPQLLTGLPTLIAADQVSYSELNPVERVSILQVWHFADGEDRLFRGDDVEEGEVFWLLRHTHPTCSYRMSSGDYTTTRKVSDFVSLREFRRTPIYDALYRGEVDYWLDVGLAPERARTRLFIFTRIGQSDFDERARLAATLLQPHLARRAEEAEAALRAAESLASIEEGATDKAQRVVLCSATGVIEFGSASARALLQRYVGLENGRVPTSLLARRKLTLRNGDRSLRIRRART